MFTWRDLWWSIPLAIVVSIPVSVGTTLLLIKVF